MPVEFDTYERSARVMGYLFGRAAGEEIVRTHRTRWWMSLGITLNTKEELTRITRDQHRRVEESEKDHGVD